MVACNPVGLPGSSCDGPTWNNCAAPSPHPLSLQASTFTTHSPVQGIVAAASEDWTFTFQ